MPEFDDYGKAAMEEVDKAIAYLDFELVSLAQLIAMGAVVQLYQTDADQWRE